MHLKIHHAGHFPILSDPTICPKFEPHSILRYVQNHTAHDPLNAAMQASRGGPPSYDGVAELWFESEEAMAANTSEAAAKAGAELLKDEKKFIDLAGSPLWFGDETEVVG